jgi:hypothetical protein
MAKKQIAVEALRHNDKRRNIPTAELEPVMDEADKTPIRLAYERRNRDLDPQLVWRGKDEQDWSDPGSGSGASLIVQAPPLYIQEKVHPKRRSTRRSWSTICCDNQKRGATRRHRRPRTCSPISTACPIRRR